MRDLLASDVQQAQGASYAFAAIKADGSAVTWGRAAYSGDSSAVRDLRASDVQQVQGAKKRLSELLSDASVDSSDESSSEC